MTPRQLQLGVDQLVQLRDRSAARQPPIVDLPVCYRPTSLAHAYTLQAEVAAALALGPAGPSVGWKIGCTTEVMQQYLHIQHPCAGWLYAAWLANHAIDNQSPLEAGQIITLGSVVKTIYPTVGTRVEARIEGLPAVSVNII